ncbi:MAG TPA: hypothetical protein VKZ53_18910 [Candidatus Angelobacter sp.]|nr:hypothetical protein [Candidatus Angelobacter sp.]
MPGQQESSGLQIITVCCPQCSRRFRTVPTVLENRGPVDCPVCGSRMNISEPQPLSVLSESRKASAA